MSKKFWVMTQAFYGNRNMVKISEDELNPFVTIGCVSRYDTPTLPDGRKILVKLYDDNDDDNMRYFKIPNTQLVVVYNEGNERDKINRNKNSNKFTPTISMPKLNFTLYSRCVICRIDDDGNFSDFVYDEDMPTMDKYLA